MEDAMYISDSDFRGKKPIEIYRMGYENGRADEQLEWKTATSELLVKYSGDIYKGLPDIIEEIQKKSYDRGRTDAFEEIKKIAIVEIDLIGDKNNGKN